MNLAETHRLPHGVLRMDVLKHGQLVERIVEDNLVVDGAKSILAALLGGAVTGKSVTKIGFGTNGAAPTGSNTALTSAFVKNLGSPTYPTGTVVFPFTLATSEANGLAIIEFGLLTTDGTLFSRRVRGAAINKDNTISFSGSWTITF